MADTNAEARAKITERVRAESAEYWDAPNSKVLHLIGYAKAAVTGKPPEAGENREVSHPG